jgi:hypothetical protein
MEKKIKQIYKPKHQNLPYNKKNASIYKNNYQVFKKTLQYMQIKKDYVTINVRFLKTILQNKQQFFY